MRFGSAEGDDVDVVASRGEAEGEVDHLVLGSTAHEGGGDEEDVEGAAGRTGRGGARMGGVALGGRVEREAGTPGVAGCRAGFVQRALEGAREGVRVVHGYEVAFLAVVENVGGATGTVGGDDGEAEGARLDEGIGHAFPVAGEGERLGVREVGEGMVDPPFEVHVVLDAEAAGERLQVVAFGSVSEDEESAGGACAGEGEGIQE